MKNTPIPLTTPDCRPHTGTSSRGRAFIGLGLILTGVACFGLANGGLFPVIGVHLAGAPNADFSIGLISSTYYIGTLLGAITAGRIIARLQYTYAFVLFASFAAVSTVLLTQTDSLVTWVALRMLTGYCMGAYYLVIESWINLKTRNTHRGRSMALYESVRVAAVAISPGLLAIGEPSDAFIIAGLLFAAAILPIGLMRARSEEPTVERIHHTPSIDLIRRRPVGPLCCLLSGIIVGAFYGFSGVYGERLGLSSAQLSFFIAVAWIAPLFTQLPIGWCADRFGRHRVILAASVFAATAAFLITLESDYGNEAEDTLPIALLMPLNFITWGLSHPIYALGVGYMNDRLPPSQFVRSGATALLAYGLGTAGGPIIASIVMQGAGNAGLYIVIAGALTALALTIPVLRAVEEK